jgi:glycerophosphoryl diester phosphodiesterase
MVNRSNAVKEWLVQSHRGGGALSPENSIASFEAAWEMGAVPEADLRTTRDGVIVAFHDDRFARLSKELSSDLREKGVKDMTFEELPYLDAGSWRGSDLARQRICSVREIFALMQQRPGSMLYMDIKDVHLPQLADLAQEFDVAERVILAAPDEQLLRDWRNLIPKGKTMLWMGILWKGDEETLRHRLKYLRDGGFAGITQLQIHVEARRDGTEWHFRPSLEFLRETTSELKQFGILFQVLPWECADAEVYHALIRVGVQSFASDYPEVALRALREYAEFCPPSP